MQGNQLSSTTAVSRVAIAFALPLLGILFVNTFLSRPVIEGVADPFRAALPLGVLGILSWFIGLRWYGLKGMGLRGHRPLYAGIGFAALVWIIFLAVRFATVAISNVGTETTGRMFIYLLLFEAFAVQLWTFGLFFRAVADWRGPLTAAVGSGVLFGAVAFLVFQESFIPATAPVIVILSGLLYFILWGVLYGVIRLRTGSLLGVVIVQAMHSLTAWHVLVPFVPPPTRELNNLYLISGLFYMLLIWRLWPKEETDYRV